MTKFNLMWIICVFLLFGCSNPGTPVKVVTEGKAVGAKNNCQLEIIAQTPEGVKVYRFVDFGHHYFTVDAQGNVGPVSNGKE